MDSNASQTGANPAQVKVCLFGVFGAGNLGNECTLEALISNFRNRAPRSEITCICSGPEETASRYNVLATAIRELSLPPMDNAAMRLVRKIFVGIPLEAYRWFDAVAKLKGKAMLVLTGTGMLGDFGISPFGLHYDILRWSVAAKLCGCKVAFVSVGVGPLRSRMSRWLVKAALTAGDYRSYRDSFSRNYLESIGFLKQSDHVYPDLAFSLLRAKLLERPERPAGASVVGVGLMTYFGKSGAGETERVYRDYLSKMASFVTWLLEHGYTVRLLIGDVVYDERVREDLKELLRSRGVVYEKVRIVDEPARSLDDVLAQLASTDVVVASRFHNVLLGLMVAKLVVAISYHEKVEALMTGVGLGEFCQDIERLDVEKLIKQLRVVEENAESLRAGIESKIEAYGRALDDQYDRLFELAPCSKV